MTFLKLDLNNSGLYPVRLWILSLCFILCFIGTKKAEAQVYAKNRAIVKMLCYLDGEIIYDPDSSLTVQALSHIDPKTLALTKTFHSPLSTELFGQKGKKGVYLMYSKKDEEIQQKNKALIIKYNKKFSEDKLKTYFPDLNRDSILDCTHPRPGDIFPAYPGGNQGLSQFISQNIHYPELALKNFIMGKIVLGLILNPDGTIENIKVISGNDLGGGIVEEALRMTRKLNRFFPGSRNHIPIKSFFTFPIQFIVDPKLTPLEPES